VKLDVAFVASVDAGGEVELLGGEPLAGEVGAEGQGPHCVCALGLLGGQLGGEPFCLRPVGASRMPPAALLAGDRVAALVDDRVEPTPTLCHVSVHDVPPSRRGSRRSEPGGTIDRTRPRRAPRRSEWPRMSHQHGSASAPDLGGTCALGFTVGAGPRAVAPAVPPRSALRRRARQPTTDCGKPAWRLLSACRYDIGRPVDSLQRMA
jgi:hypothetical protein